MPSFSTKFCTGWFAAGVLLGTWGTCFAAHADQRTVENGSAFYHWISKSFFDVDKLLAEQLKIEFSSCEYYSNLSNTVLRDRGVGSCLFRALEENFSSPAIAGMVRAKAHSLVGGKGEHQKETLVHIVWNPSNRKNTVISNVFRLVSELIVPSWIKTKDDAIWGTLVFRFPKHDGFDLIPNEIVRSLIDPDGQPLDMFSITMFPVGDRRDAGTLQGVIYFFGQGATVEHPMYQIHFKTDLPERGDNHFLEMDAK